MNYPILILHIDKDFQASYWILREAGKIVSQVTIPQAIQLLKAFEFDLIVSEPQNLAILRSHLNPSIPSDGQKEEDTEARPLLNP